jgi:C-terminal processing protease CtpA/Prc
MPVPAGRILYRDALVTVDTVEYAGQVNKARLVPDTPISTWKGLQPDAVVQDVDTTTWQLELAGLQIRGASGLAEALTDASGTEVEVTLQPKVGTGQPTATVTIVAMPVEFGGEQGNYLTFDATFPVVGQPTFGTSV